MMDESLNSTKSQEQNDQKDVRVAADFANNLKRSASDLLGLIPIAAIAIALIVAIVAIVYGVIEIWIFAIGHLGTAWGNSRICSYYVFNRSFDHGSIQDDLGRAREAWSC